MNIKIFHIILVWIFIASLHGQTSGLKTLQSDIFLHPADGFTAHTLHKGEVVYNQSPFTLPLPSWAWWGITNKLTAEIDLLPLTGGLFEEPHFPVPSFNFRYKIYEQKQWQPSIAFETMFQYLWNKLNQSDQSNIIITRKGASWYNRFNFSWKINYFIHIYLPV